MVTKVSILTSLSLYLTLYARKRFELDMVKHCKTHAEMYELCQAHETTEHRNTGSEKSINFQTKSSFSP